MTDGTVQAAIVSLTDDLTEIHIASNGNTIVLENTPNMIEGAGYGYIHQQCYCCNQMFKHHIDIAGRAALYQAIGVTLAFLDID